MSKTPIMILQELMVKSGSLPVYELVDVKMGTHKNSFTIKVTCQNLSAKGTASSKKEAKQQAASEMLKLLQQPKDANDSNLCKIPDSTQVSVPMPIANEPACNSSTNEDSTNYVGKLQEYCAKNQSQIPSYDILEESGPSHLKTFKMKCTLGSLQAVASASTKKKAKQEVSKKIIQDLVEKYNLHEDANGDLVQESPDKQIIELGVSIIDLKLDGHSKSNTTVERVKDYYKEFVPNFHKLDTKDVSIDQHHLYFKDRYSVSESVQRNLMFLWKEIKNSTSLVNKAVHKAVKLISKEFGTLERINLTGKNQSTLLIGFRLNTSPKILEIGVGKTIIEAEAQAIMKTLDTIMLMIR